MKILISTAAACLLTVLPGSAFAGHVRDVDELANELQRDMAQICREVRVHFRHTAEYRHLYKDAYDMYSRAVHIHDVAHHMDRRALGEIEQDVAALDDLYHHVEELVSQLKRRSGGHGHDIRHGGRGRGRVEFRHGGSGVNGFHLRQLIRMLDHAGDTLHTLQEVVAAHHQRLMPGNVMPPLPPGAGPVLPPLNVPPQMRPRQPRRSISFGDNGRFRFSLRLN